MKTIRIEKTVGADTRSSGGLVAKETLLRESHLHKSHVRKLMGAVAAEIVEKAEAHDHTKISHIDSFHDSFLQVFANGAKFKELPWWAEHLKERHHINDYMHEDTDLTDLIEMLADCVVAGKARTGTVYPIEVSSDKLQKILANTVTKFIAAVDVE